MSTSALKAAATGTSMKKAERPTTIHGFLETYKGEIARALPKHMTADRMARIALTEFRKTPALMKCDPATLFGSVIQCAQLGLEPGGALGHAYLIPFENRKKGTTDVQFIIGYRGMIDLARRSGQIVSLTARVVNSNDKFVYHYGLDETIEHIPAEGDRGDMTHVYAVAKLKDGGVQFEVMSRHDIEAVRNESQGYKTAMRYDRKDSPWIAHFEEMAKKTVIRRLFKYLPVSIELQRAVALDEQGEAGVAQGNAAVIDGVFSHEEDTDHQDAELQAVEQRGAKAQTQPEFPPISFAIVADKLNKAEDADLLAAAADLIGEIADEKQRAELTTIYKARQEEMQA